MPETSTFDPTKNRFGETVKFLPVVFVLGIITGLWLIYTLYHCIPRPETESRWRPMTWEHQLIEVVIFNVSTFLLFVCYIRCILVHPGTIPDDEEHWNYVQSPESGQGHGLSTAELAAVGVPLEKKKTGERRSCKWCSKYKPDRCHHCRVCRMCILKMDHHCPWIYNCVGFNNHKYFFLLLFYCTIDLQIVVWTMKDSLHAALNNPNTPFISMFLLLFGETLASFLGVLVTVFFAFHVWLMLKAMTTIEFCEKSMKRVGYDGSVYDRGTYGNIKAVLGDNPFLWFLPLSPPSGTGMNFQTEESHLSSDLYGRYTGQTKDSDYRTASMQTSGAGSQPFAMGGADAGSADDWGRDVEGGVPPGGSAGSGDSGTTLRRKHPSGGNIRERRPSSGTGAAPDFDCYGSEEEGSASDNADMQVTAANLVPDNASEVQSSTREARPE